MRRSRALRAARIGEADNKRAAVTLRTSMMQVEAVWQMPDVVIGGGPTCD